MQVWVSIRQRGACRGKGTDDGEPARTATRGLEDGEHARSTNCSRACIRCGSGNSSRSESDDTAHSVPAGQIARLQSSLCRHCRALQLPLPCESPYSHVFRLASLRVVRSCPRNEDKRYEPRRQEAGGLIPSGFGPPTTCAGTSSLCKLLPETSPTSSLQSAVCVPRRDPQPAVRGDRLCFAPSAWRARPNAVRAPR